MKINNTKIPNVFEAKIIEVTRCISDLKFGIPIILEHKNQKNLILSLERINKKIFNEIKNALKEVNLVITQQRTNFLKLKHCKINCQNLDFNEVEKIAFGLEDVDLNAHDYYEMSNSDEKALMLLKISELIPVAIIAKVDPEMELNFRINSLKSEYIDDFAAKTNDDLYEVCNADLKLKFGRGKIKCFRSQFSKDHYAIIINSKHKKNDNETPLVRVHSSCFTGDIFDSIKCDCHEQFHNAIKIMSEKGGGVIIYLNQEGRGIGLTNKIRVYKAQSSGFDTVEANENLGFESDARGFIIASKILKKLNINKIDLLSNNPAKAKDLTKQGIMVENVIAHQFLSSDIKNYYDSKAKKLNHDIEV
ncbi:MAG: GTP cyclohydrolase II [Rickettsiales bacterium]|nr:GTP cyclohydrolase II [Rickettsiales bacterium]